MDRRKSAKIFESGAKVFYVKYLKKKDKKGEKTYTDYKKVLEKLK